MTDKRWDGTTPPATGLPAEGSVVAAAPPVASTTGTPTAAGMAGTPPGLQPETQPERSTASRVADKGVEVADRATDQAAGVKDHALDAAAEIKDHAGAEVRSLKHEAEEQARDLAGEARQLVQTHADDTTNQVAGALADAGRELTRMASSAEHQDSPATEVVRQIGERAVRTAERLQDQGYQGVAQDLTRWARKHPGTFLMAAGVAGFVAGRLLRNVDTSSIAEAAKGNDSNGADSSYSPPAVARTDVLPTEIQLAEESYPTVPDVPTMQDVGTASGVVR